jgi:hypothetical protein
MDTRKRSGIGRGIAVLTLGMLAAGALSVAPATGAVDGLSKKEKKQGDKRWINVGEKASDADKLDGQDSAAFMKAGDAYTKAEADARFPQAYARVEADGTLDTGMSKGVAAVSNPSPGQFCFNLSPSVTARNAVASVDGMANSPGDAQTVMAADAVPSVCVPSGNTDAAVFTWTGASNVNRAFYVLFN